MNNSRFIDASPGRGPGSVAFRGGFFEAANAHVFAHGLIDQLRYIGPAMRGSPFEPVRPFVRGIDPDFAKPRGLFAVLGFLLGSAHRSNAHQTCLFPSGILDSSRTAH